MTSRIQQENSPNASPSAYSHPYMCHYNRIVADGEDRGRTYRVLSWDRRILFNVAVDTLRRSRLTKSLYSVSRSSSVPSSLSWVSDRLTSSRRMNSS